MLFITFSICKLNNRLKKSNMNPSNNIPNIFRASVDAIKAATPITAPNQFVYVFVYCTLNTGLVYSHILVFYFVFFKILVTSLLPLRFCYLLAHSIQFISDGSVLNPVLLMLLTCSIGWRQGWTGSSRRTGEARPGRPTWTHRSCRSQGGSRWRRTRWLSGAPRATSE